MYKTGILNSDISKVLSDLGHTDQIIIADCGLPVPKHVKKIDLALELGTPNFESVYEVVMKHMNVQKLIFAHEIKQENQTLYNRLDLNGIETEFISHEIFKKLSHKAIAVIRTGEATPYANVILEGDVLF